ncbi:MAG: helix-turn-helix domain-containing protein [Methanocellales archaeon]|nr:helix-turn-helix domain-containing protein [Methanocellales archaeon]
MKLPCELVVWYVLPIIRSELAKELVKLGLSQKEVSKRLGITQAAVSQYLNDKRGRDIKFKVDVKEEIKEIAKDTAIDNAFSNLTLRICEVCTRVKTDKTLCELHKEHYTVPEGCNVCLE